MSINIKEIQKLRELTGAGIMDCKSALKEADGNIEEARKFLRIKGLNKINKKANSEANEGLISVNKNGKEASIILLNSETDFVAMNDKFKDLAQNIAAMAIINSDKNKLLTMQYPNSKNTLADEIKETAFIMGENIILNKVDVLKTTNGIVSSYIHGSSKKIGRIAALVAIEVDSVTEELENLGYKIAMHIVASTPIAIDIDQLDAAVVEKERNVVREQAISLGKPNNVVEKIIEGRLAKFYQESVLLKQPYCADNSITISDLLNQYAKDYGVQPKIIDYRFYKVGER